eukprot:5265-Heterococcus_DN1.PRE.17
MAPLYAVMLTVMGACVVAGGTIYEKISALESEVRRVEQLSAEKVKTAKAQAFEDASRKFLMYGYAAEYSKHQTKTVPEQTTVQEKNKT